MADSLIFKHGNNASNLGSIINGKVYFLHNGPGNIGYLYADFNGTRYFFGTGDRTNFTDINVANKIWFNNANYYINSDGYANLSNVNASWINGELVGANRLAITNAVSSIIPNGNKTLNLGASKYRWNYLYVNHITSSRLVAGAIGSNLIPNTETSTYTLGNEARYWASGYINTIYSQINTIFDINSNYYINNTGYANLHTIQGTQANITNINSNSITTNVMGITTLGSSTAAIGNLSVNSMLTSLIPLNENTRINLGSVNYKWDYAHLNNLSVYNNLSFIGDSNNSYYINNNGNGQLNTMTITNIIGTNITANVGNITSLNSSNATINNLTVTTNSILNAMSASTATIDSASITTLGATNITASNVNVTTRLNLGTGTYYLTNLGSGDLGNVKFTVNARFGNTHYINNNGSGKLNDINILTNLRFNGTSYYITKSGVANLANTTVSNMRVNTNLIFLSNANNYINASGSGILDNIAMQKSTIVNATIGNLVASNFSTSSVLTSLIPLNANTSIDLGSSNNKWNQAFLNNIGVFNNLHFMSNINCYINSNGSGQLDTMTITNITGADATITNLASTNIDSTTLNVTGNTTLNAANINSASITTASITTLGVNHITTNYLTVSTQVLSALVPNTNKTLALGGSAARWGTIYGNVVNTSAYIRAGTYVNAVTYVQAGSYVNATTYVNAGTQLQVGGTTYFFNSNGYLNTLTAFGNYVNFAYANIRTNLYMNGTTYFFNSGGYLNMSTVNGAYANILSINSNLVSSKYINLYTNMYINGANTYFINAAGYANFLTVRANTVNGTYLRVSGGNAFFTNAHIYQTKNATGTFYYTNYTDGTLTSTTMFLANVNTTNSRVLLALGTGIANTNTTAPGFRGALRLYGNSTSYMTLYAPDVGNGGDIFLPNIGGELMIHTKGSATGNTNRPVYIAANGSPVVVTNFVNTSGLVAVNRVNASYLYVGTNVISALVPNANATYNLGSASYKWLNMYGKNVYSNYVHGNYVYINSVNGKTYFYVNAGSTSPAYAYYGLGNAGDGTNSNIGYSIAVLGNNLAASSTNGEGANNMRGALLLYTATNYYSYIVPLNQSAHRTFYIPTTTTTTQFIVNRSVTSINPSTNNSIYLGNSTYRWAGAYTQNLLAYNRLYGVYLTTGSSTYGSAPPSGTWAGQIYFKKST